MVTDNGRSVTLLGAHYNPFVVLSAIFVMLGMNLNPAVG